MNWGYLAENVKQDAIKLSDRVIIRYLYAFVLGLYIGFSNCHQTCAQSLSGHVYDQAAGLTDFDPIQLLQARSGALFANTQGASFVFDGVHFAALGTAQGLRNTTTFADLALSPDAQAIVATQWNQVFVAIDPRPFSLSALHFVPVTEPKSDGAANYGMLSSFGSGMVVQTGTGLRFLDVSNPRKPHFSPLPPIVSRANQAISAPLSFFGTNEAFWVSRHDGQICMFALRGDRCWGPKDGLPNRRWGGFLQLSRGVVAARTGTLLAILDTAREDVSIETIPDTSSTFDTYSRLLKLQRLPNGDLMTQSTHGVAIRHDAKWHALRLTDGTHLILPLELDASGSIWLGTFGEGFREYFGYGAVENWTMESGLSSGIVWGVDRQKDGPLWIGTDGGLDVLQSKGSPRTVYEDRTVETVSPGRPGILWIVINSSLLERLDTRTGDKREFSLRELGTVKATGGGTVWIATSDGLYHLFDDGSTVSQPALVSSRDLALTDLSLDRYGTLWMTGSGALWRKLLDKPVELVTRSWPDPNVQTEAVASSPDGTVWVGSMNGLYHVSLSGSRTSIEKVSDSSLPNTTINALLVDDKRRLWVGTSNGIAVQQDGRWISADTISGLAGNDIAEDSIFADGDGSMWIGTSQGLSHIIDPTRLLKRFPLHPVILSTEIGGHPYSGEHLPYQRAPITVQLGILDDPQSPRVHYRYRIEGIDFGWREVWSNQISDPVVPAGHHRLIVEAYDAATHTSSEPIAITIDMALPWWRQPWFYVGLGILLVGAIWLMLRLRTHYLVRQRSALVREVQARTAELERAHAELKIQARQDKLTGLLNRGAVQDALTLALAAADEPTLAVGLIDIDHFKHINDTYGHLCGDAVLVAMGQRFLKQLRTGDLVGRFGGEEYVLAIPEGDGTGTQRIRAIIDQVTRDPIAYNGELIAVTVSAGIALAEPDDIWDDVIGRADAALYRAKREGRNRVVAA